MCGYARVRLHMHEYEQCADKPHLPFFAPQEFFQLYPDPPPPVPELPSQGAPCAVQSVCVSARARLCLFVLKVVVRLDRHAIYCMAFVSFQQPQPGALLQLGKLHRYRKWQPSNSKPANYTVLQTQQSIYFIIL